MRGVKGLESRPAVVGSSAAGSSMLFAFARVVFVPLQFPELLVLPRPGSLCSIDCHFSTVVFAPLRIPELHLPRLPIPLKAVQS
jgi:hypothetical protein